VRISVARFDADASAETTLILASAPANLSDAHRERLEEAIGEARAAVSRLERAMAAAARPAPVTA
jgi:hypothetical protein